MASAVDYGSTMVTMMTMVRVQALARFIVLYS